MSEGRGRKPSWTAEQAERVLELAAAGVSQRAIAKEVFATAVCGGGWSGSSARALERAAVSEGEPLELQSLLAEDLEAPELRRLFRFYDEVRVLDRRGAFSGRPGAAAADPPEAGDAHAGGEAKCDVPGVRFGRRGLPRQPREGVGRRCLDICGCPPPRAGARWG